MEKIMNCPICGNKMEKGFIQAAGRMMWTQKLRKVLLTFPKSDEIMFRSGIITRCYCTAYLCRSCKKIIMDYADEAAIINQRK